MDSYNFNFKSEVIKFVEENGNNPAARRYKITPKMVREWRKKKEEIVDVVSGKRKKNNDKRLPGSGTPVINNDINENLLEWNFEQRTKRLHVSRKIIMVEAKAMHDEMYANDLRDTSTASRG